MSTPYQLVHPNARKHIAERKVYFLSKARECEQILRTLDSLDALLTDHPILGDAAAGNPMEAAPSDAGPGEVDETGSASADPLATQHRRKEDLYDEEMLRLLARVKVASKLAVFQHFHAVLRGNTSIGAVESYLKRAVLRGIIARRTRGEYILPPRSD